MNMNTPIGMVRAKHMRKDPESKISVASPSTATISSMCIDSSGTPSVLDAAAAAADIGWHEKNDIHRNPSIRCIPSPSPSCTPTKSKIGTLFSDHLIRKLALRSSKGKSPKPTLGDLFFDAPTEIRLEIISHLPIPDIINLRKTCRSFHHLISEHESHIVNQYSRNYLPIYIIQLFPIHTGAPTTLKYLGDIIYRHETSIKLAVWVSETILREIKGWKRGSSTINLETYDSYLERIRSRITPLLLALFHFLETYHARVTSGDYNDSSPKPSPFSTSIADKQLQDQKNQYMQAEILQKYPHALLLQIHEMYIILMNIMLDKLTPYRQWTWFSRRVFWLPGDEMDFPTNQDNMKLMVFGGIPALLRILKLKGAGPRRKAFWMWLRQLEKQEPQLSAQPRKWLPCRKRWMKDPPHGGVGIGASSSTIPTKAKPSSIHLDDLHSLWVPASEQLLLARGIVKDKRELRMYWEFIACKFLGEDLDIDDERLLGLGDGDSVWHDAVLGASWSGEGAEGSSALTQQVLARLKYEGGENANWADDGTWDDDFIVEDGDEWLALFEEALTNETEAEKGNSITNPGKCKLMAEV